MFDIAPKDNNAILGVCGCTCSPVPSPNESEMLAGNSIGDEGAIALSGILGQLHLLQNLDLSCTSPTCNTSDVA